MGYLRALACGIIICAAGLLAACGHGSRSSISGPVVYNPDLRNQDCTDTNRYYDADYTSRFVSTRDYGTIYKRYYRGSSLTYLTPVGQQADDLRNHGLGWLAQYPDSHTRVETGALSVAPASYIFSVGASTPRRVRADSPVYLSAIGDNQAYVVYALSGIPEGYGITNIALLGEWTYVDLAASGGLRIGVSSYSDHTRSFTGYNLSGDLYHPQHWNFTSRTGIPASPDGAAYILIAVHDGLEARLDSVTVTIE
jgi:hypothetical protein